MKKICIVLILLLSGCTEQEVIEIGVIASLTGPGAYLGLQEVRGLEIAVDEINQNGGINGREVKLVVEDSKSDPKSAVSAFQRLSINNVEYIVGDSWTVTTTTIVPILENVLLVSPTATLDSLGEDDLFFRVTPTTTDMMRTLAEYAYDNDIRRVAVLYADNAFASEHADAFEREFSSLGGEIVAKDTFLPSTTDLKPQLLKVKEAEAILNLHISGPHLALPIEDSIELGLEVQWLASFGAESGELIEAHSEVVDGMIYPYTIDYDSKSASIFIEKYESRYGSLPDVTAVNAYDILNILSVTIGDNVHETKANLLSLEDYPGASGVFSFDENGDVEKEVIIKQVKDGEFVRID